MKPAEKTATLIETIQPEALKPILDEVAKAEDLSKEIGHKLFQLATLLWLSSNVQEPDAEGWEEAYCRVKESISSITFKLAEEVEELFDEFDGAFTHCQMRVNWKPKPGCSLNPSVFVTLLGFIAKLYSGKAVAKQGVGLGEILLNQSLADPEYRPVLETFTNLLREKGGNVECLFYENGRHEFCYWGELPQTQGSSSLAGKEVAQ